MSTPEFDIIFRGDIVFGHQMTDVKLKLQQLFKVDAAKVDALFTGRPVPLKRNLDEATATKYREVLLKAGAVVEISPSDKTPGAAAARPAANTEAKTASAPVSAALTPTSAPAVTTVAATVTATAKEPSRPSVAPTWTIAPTGTDLLAETERNKPTPVTVDISGISLRPVSGNLLDDSEVKPMPAPNVTVPNLDVAEAGANLINPDEKNTLPLMEFDVSDWEIAELGSDLLQPDEHPKVTPVVVDVSQFDLAPAGSDLGQLKPQVKTVVPDISGIKLADSN